MLESSESGQYQAELVNDNSWNETEINASNSPDGSTVLAAWGRGDDIEINVTNELIDALSKDKKLSIRIVSTLNNGKVPSYGSREHSNPNARPKLFITSVSETNTELSSKETSAISIYPNPCSDRVYISALVDQVEIFDISGKIIRKVHTPTSSLDVSNLKKGPYIFRITCNNEIHNQLLMK